MVQSLVNPPLKQLHAFQKPIVPAMGFSPLKLCSPLWRRQNLTNSQVLPPKAVSAEAFGTTRLGDAKQVLNLTAQREGSQMLIEEPGGPLLSHPKSLS